MSDFFIKTIVEQYSKTQYGAWLNDFNWSKVKVQHLTFQIEGVITAFYCSIRDTIKIAPDNSDAVFFSTLIHQMRHAYQRYKYGILKYLFLKTFRRSLLQHDAQAQQIKAVQWFCNV